MCKKALTVILSGFICAFFTLVTTVKAAEFNLGDLGECKRIYSCGNRAAYFYGYTNTALISSRLSDDCRTSRVNINGVIRSVTHSGSFTYALFSVSNRQYSVIMLNADSGDYSIIDLNSDFEIDPKSIAADSSEIFVLSLSATLSALTKTDKGGTPIHFRAARHCFFQTEKPLTLSLRREVSTVLAEEKPSSAQMPHTTRAFQTRDRITSTRTASLFHC